MLIQIGGMLVIGSKVLGNKFSWFIEFFNARDLSAAIGFDTTAAEYNQSYSKQLILRGMRFQAKRPQGRLARAEQSCIFNVGVDAIKILPTYRKWTGVELSTENRKQMWSLPI